jgi:tetratricopeptide (TPR) repeat protein
MGWVFLLALAIAPADFERALDAQDGAALEAEAQKLEGKADAASLYRQALAYSYAAEVAIEQGDKKKSASLAGHGIAAAERAVKADASSSENHRILGTLCGQVIPANPLAGISRGRCALDELTRAIELNPKSSMAYVSRGIGNYYLPAMFGGGMEKAIPDLRKAVELDAKNAEAHLWLGLALRKSGKNQEARASMERSLALRPKRKWAVDQLAKTPQ